MTIMSSFGLMSQVLSYYLNATSELAVTSFKQVNEWNSTLQMFPINTDALFYREEQITAFNTISASLMDLCLLWEACLIEPGDY